MYASHAIASSVHVSCFWASMALGLVSGCESKGKLKTSTTSSAAVSSMPQAPVAPTAQAPNECGAVGPLAEHFAGRAWAKWLSEPTGDYSGETLPARCRLVLTPERKEQVMELLRIASVNGLSVRVRGAGHSANGSSLPGKGEVLLSTSRLNRVSFQRPGTVTAQAGVSMHQINREAERVGFKLPVINDGWSGPTLGGYVSAGGMGAGVKEHGGFWNHVASMTVVDGVGQVRVLRREDPEFLWYFGAMGQLGVIVSAELAVVGTGSYPVGVSKRIPSGGAVTPPTTQERLVWFTLLVSKAESDAAERQLSALEKAHQPDVQMLGLYRYDFRDQGPPPPLFYGRAGSFSAVGTWARTSDAKVARVLEREFTLLVNGQGYRRYIQSELTRTPEEYRRYFGEALYSRFKQLKLKLDPCGILNPGSVFERTSSRSPGCLREATISTEKQKGK